MKLPRLFEDIHQNAMVAAFRKYGPVFHIIPKEPLPALVLDQPCRGMTVTMVTIRGINDGGVLRFEAFSDADMRVVKEWCEKCRDTPRDKFTWLPLSDDERRVA